MSDFSDLNNPKTTRLIICLYLVLTVLGGILTLSSILRVPTESVKAVFLGLSVQRLIIFVFIFCFTTIACVLLVKILFDRTFAGSFQTIIQTWAGKGHCFGTILIFTIVAIVWGANFLVQIPNIHEPVALAYYLRLQPFVLWLMTLSIQTLIASFFLRFGLNPPAVRNIGRRIYPYLLSFGLILILVIWVSGTGYGINPIDEGIGWHPLGTPILLSQLLLAWIASVFILFIPAMGMPDQPGKASKMSFKFDLALCLALWLTAFTLWMVQPLKANWFAAEPRPPNYQFYPGSDASVYDITAINLSLGAGFMTRGSPFTLRPLYSAFLAGLHQVAGSGYESIIWIQVISLALIPVFLYLLTTSLHNRASAFFVAFLFILREMNAIKLGDSISDAHAKLLMPFLPATLGAVLFIWLISRWMQDPRRKTRTALLAGGTLGLFMLIRPEIFIILPVVVTAALLQLQKNIRLWLQGSLLVFIGLSLAIAPWLWRNYQITGTIYIDSPHYRLDLLTRRYRQDPIGFSLPEPTASVADSQGDLPLTSVPETIEPGLLDLSKPTTSLPPGTQIQELKPEISTSQPQTIPNPPLQETIQQSTEGFASNVLAFIKQNPGMTANFIADHFMNSVIQTIQTLPLSYPITYSIVTLLGHRSIQTFWLDCCSLLDYERKVPFWPRWDGIFPEDSFVPLAVTLLVVSAGIATSWRKTNFIGLIPLFSALSYYLVNALVRNSGGRYIIPLNWVGFLYFSIGLIQVSQYILSFFNRKLRPNSSFFPIQPSKTSLKNPFQFSHHFIVAVGIFLVGAVLPILEETIPQKYDQGWLEERQKTLYQVGRISKTEAALLEYFLKNGGKVLHGQALYARFHKPYQMGSVWRIYYNRPYAHLDFYLSTPGDTGVVLPLAQSPRTFPHATDIIVYGCDQEEDFQALMTALFSVDGSIKEVIWRYPMPNTPSCPLPLDN